MSQKTSALIDELRASCYSRGWAASTRDAEKEATEIAATRRAVADLKDAIAQIETDRDAARREVNDLRSYMTGYAKGNEILYEEVKRLRAELDARTKPA